MKKYVFWISLLFICNQSLNADPNISDRQGFIDRFADVYSDLQNNDQSEVLYFYQMPTKLVIDKNKLTGKSSYNWTSLPDGTAMIQMSVSTFADPISSLQVLKDLNQQYSKKIRFKHFEVKDLQISQLEDTDLIQSISPVLRSGSTQAVFPIRIRLTELGVLLWPQLIASGGLITNPTLNFKAKFVDTSGNIIWQDQSISLEIGNLPTANTVTENSLEAIKSWAIYQGELAYWYQFKSCSGLYRGDVFEIPSASELNPVNSGYNEEEKKVYREFMLKGFEDEVIRQRQQCQSEIDRLEAIEWWNAYEGEANIKTCQQSIPDWSKVYFLVHLKSTAFKTQVEALWKKKVEFCQKPLTITNINAVVENGCLQYINFSLSERVDSQELLRNLVIYATKFESLEYRSFKIINTIGNDIIVGTKDEKFCNDGWDGIKIKAGLQAVSGRRLWQDYKYKINYR